MIEGIILSKLEGTSGSNPQIIEFFPKQVEINPTELLKKTLPNGCSPTETFLDSMGKQKQPLVGFCFENRTEHGRNAIASIGFILTKNARVDDFRKIITDLIQFIQQANCMNIKFLHDHLKDLFTCINEFTPFYINNSSFNFQQKVQDMNLNPIHLPRKRKGII